MNSCFPRTPAHIAALLLAIATMVTPAFAAKVQKNALPNTGLFGIKITNTDWEFYGRADSVLSVSFQEYTTGPLIVSEVVIDMQGSNQLLRLYSSRPPSEEDVSQTGAQAAETLTEASLGSITPTLPTPTPPESTRHAHRVAERAASSIVVKTYPVTTHAKTVEFAVKSRQELLAFHKNFRDVYIKKGVQTRETGHAVPADRPAAIAANASQMVTVLGGTLFTIE